MHPAKEYLLRIRLLESKIESLDEEIERNQFMMLPGGIRYDSDRVQTSLKNKLEEAVLEMLDIREKQIAQRIKLIRTRTRIINQIGMVPDVLQYNILMDYYVRGFSLVQIAKKRNYAYDTIVHEHGSALNSFAKIVMKRKVKQ